jgi:glycosyltransferase involved in cell wall biosynthesis
MARILWGSEQPIRPTGYAVVSREIIKRLIADYGHEIYVMGWDYNGENMTHDEGWTLVHAGIGQFGAEKLTHNAQESPSVLDFHIGNINPDVFISLIDCWFTGHMVLSANQAGVPHIAYTPIDGVPISHQWSRILGHTHTNLWMSEFGKKEWEKFCAKHDTIGDGHPALKFPDLDRYRAGVDENPMIYHGVDIDVFKPMNKKEKQATRDALQVRHKTLLSSVGRNTNRKQIPRLLKALRIALDKLDDPDAIGLVLHCGDPTDMANMGGWKLPDLIKQFGLSNNVMFSDGSSNPLHGISREDLARLYGCTDAHVLATGGEGFGIPSAEAMSCGIPIILPDNSTGPELIGPDNERGWLVPCSESIIGPKWGVEMGLVDCDALADVLIEVHNNPVEARKRGEKARKFVVENLDWDIIAKQFHDLIESRVGMPHPMQTFIETRGDVDDEL